MRKVSLPAILVAALLAVPAWAVEDKPADTSDAKKDEVKKDAPKAEAEAGDKEAKKVDAFAEALKKSDPAAYERFMSLRAERDKNLEELKKVQADLKKGSSEEKINLYQQFKIAKKKYAESYIKFIEFLDERDDQIVSNYEKTIQKIKQVKERRKKAREELERAMKEEG